MRDIMKSASLPFCESDNININNNIVTIVSCNASWRIVTAILNLRQKFLFFIFFICLNCQQTNEDTHDMNLLE